MRQLLWASQHQLEVVEQGDPTILVLHLERRNQLWGEFELLDKQLTPHKGIPLAQRVYKSADERELTELLLQRCQELLDEIMANDQISMAKAEELQKKVEQDLRRVQAAKSSAPAYLRQSKIQR